MSVGTAVAARADTTLWGVNPGLPLLYYQQETRALPARDLPTIHGIGIAQVLADAVWASAVPSAGSQDWQWASTDRYVAALARAHLRWYPRIDYTPSFYSTNPLLIEGGDPQPQFVGQLQAYAEALAARYGPNGGFWLANRGLPYLPVEDYEVWNEPNVPGVMDESDAAGATAFMEMYAAAWQGIHAADANATVTFAGLAITGNDPVLGSESASDWLAQAVGADPRQPIDAVGLHPYPYEIATNGLVGGVWVQVRALRAELRALGLGAVPIQATEFGFASSYVGLATSPGDAGLTFTNAQRSQAMQTVALELPHSDCNVDAIVPFVWNPATEVSSPTPDENDYIYTQYQLATPSDGTAGQEATGYKQAVALSKVLGTKVFTICGATAARRRDRGSTYRPPLSALYPSAAISVPPR